MRISPCAAAKHTHKTHRKPEYKPIDNSWQKVLLENNSAKTTQRLITVAADTEKKGNMCLNIFLKKIQRYVDEDPNFEMTYSKGYIIDDVLTRYITKGLCETVSCKF